MQTPRALLSAQSRTCHPSYNYDCSPWLSSGQRG